MSEVYYSPIGETWESMRARLCTPEELAASRERVKIILKKADERDARERHTLAKQAQVRTYTTQGETRASL